MARLSPLFVRAFVADAAVPAWLLPVQQQGLLATQQQCPSNSSKPRLAGPAAVGMGAAL
jgi:hypothetical protein